jgi:hypothetical protein
LNTCRPRWQTNAVVLGGRLFSAAELKAMGNH